MFIVMVFAMCVRSYCGVEFCVWLAFKENTHDDLILVATAHVIICFI